MGGGTHTRGGGIERGNNCTRQVELCHSGELEVCLNANCLLGLRAMITIEMSNEGGQKRQVGECSRHATL